MFGQWKCCGILSTMILRNRYLFRLNLFITSCTSGIGDIFSPATGTQVWHVDFFIQDPTIQLRESWATRKLTFTQIRPVLISRPLIHRDNETFCLRGHLGVPDTVSGPLIVPLNYLTILHLIRLKAYILWNTDKCWKWYRFKGIPSTWLQKLYASIGVGIVHFRPPDVPLTSALKKYYRWPHVAGGIRDSVTIETRDQKGP